MEASRTTTVAVNNTPTQNDTVNDPISVPRAPSSEDINIPNVNVDARDALPCDNYVPADGNKVITSQTVPAQMNPTALRRSTRIRRPVDRFESGND